MARTITVTDKATKAITTVVGQEVSLSMPSVVLLPIPRAQVKYLAREGNDLVIATVNGETIVVHGFLAGDQTDSQTGQTSETDHSDLVFQDENGGLWLTDWSDLSALPVDTSIDPATAAGGAGAFTPVDSIDALLGDTSYAAAAGGAEDASGWLPPVLALAGFATALAAAASLGSSSSPSPSTKLGPPHVDHNNDGTITVWGEAGATDPGNTVTVTFPDKTTKPVTAESDGSYKVTSDTPQGNGQGHVAATDPNTGASSGQDYTYTFTMPNPTIDSVTDNANGTVTVAGSAQLGSDVKVVFSDNSSKTVHTDSSGHFTVSSDTNLPTGTLTATAMEPGGLHVSGPVSHDYTQFDSGNGISWVVDQPAPSVDLVPAPDHTALGSTAPGAGKTNSVHGIGADTSTTVQHDVVNGGEGWNTLVFEQSNLNVDLTQMGSRVQGFGQFDLNNQSNTAASDPKGLFSDAAVSNTLALRLSDVLSESNGTTGANGKHMTILGDATSTVQLEGSATLAATHWVVTGQQTVDGVTFDVYHNTTMGANTLADLLIQQGVHVI
jgi:hypothetical protein